MAGDREMPAGAGVGSSACAGAGNRARAAIAAPSGGRGPRGQEAFARRFAERLRARGKEAAESWGA